MNENIKHHKNFRDLSGKIFGRWTVIRRGPNSRSGHTRYFCKCECGNEVLVYSVNLTRGVTSHCTSCSARLKNNYHGMSESKTYSVYIQMIERCHNPNHKFYSYYGKRGIYVCERWQAGFKNFLEDMGEVPEGLSLDRIDNEKGYSKENCRWTTKKEQQRNRRNSIRIGDVYNDWEIIDRLSENKTYLIKCKNCNYTRKILSCNFRHKAKHQCIIGNNYENI